MQTVANLMTQDKPFLVHYARLYTLECYAVRLPCGLVVLAALAAAGEV